jgi:hypothetical protein
LVEVCRIVDTLLIDHETVYAPRQGNDRLLLGLKGNLNEYGLDLLRQRSVEARYAKARRGELIIASPVTTITWRSTRRVQEAVLLVFNKFIEIGSVWQTMMWFLENGLELPTQTSLRELCWKRRQHPPSPFPLVRLSFGFAPNLTPFAIALQLPSAHEDHLALDRRKSGDKRHERFDPHVVAEPIAASNASKIMLFILSFRCSNGDGHSQWLSPFSFGGLQTMRRAKLICESPSSAKRIPDDLATSLKRVSPFKGLANKAATFRQARYRAPEESKNHPSGGLPRDNK